MINLEQVEVIYNAKTRNEEIKIVEISQEEIIRNETIKRNNEIQAQINDLKKQLETTDYKIIKASEYNLLGLQCEYNIQELHTERQAIRDEINQLEQQINT